MPLRFTSAMQTRTQDAAPEPAKQTGCQRAPGKVQLRLDLIQRPSCYTTQPARFRAKNTPANKAKHHTEHAANAAAAITIPQWLLCQTSATISQLQCKQVHRHYVQSNATCGDAIPSHATAGKNYSDTPQPAGAKASADSSTSPSETRMGQSIQTQVQPKCNTIAKQAAWQHHCKRKCNAGVNTNATQVQMQWKPADTCKPVHTQCKRKCKRNCNRRNNPQMQVQVQTLENRSQTCHRFFPQHIRQEGFNSEYIEYDDLG